MSTATKLYAFHSGGENADWASIHPFSDRAGEKTYLPYFFYVIEHHTGWVMFDTGAHPALRTGARARLGDEADNWEILLDEDDTVEHHLATIGLTPADIDHLVLSHLHYDHCGGVHLFPHAKIYVQQDELDFARTPPIYQEGLYVSDDFEHPAEWVTLHGRHDVFGDGTVTIVPTVGHTRGHQSLQVTLPGSTVVLVADAAYLPVSLAHKLLPAVLWNPDEMVNSWNILEAIQQEGDAMLLFTHDVGYADHVRIAPAYYD